MPRIAEIGDLKRATPRGGGWLGSRLQDWIDRIRKSVKRECTIPIMLRREPIGRRKEVEAVLGRQSHRLLKDLPQPHGSLVL